MGLSICFHILIPHWISCYNTKKEYKFFFDTLEFLNPLYLTINKLRVNFLEYCLVIWIKKQQQNRIDQRITWVLDLISKALVQLQGITIWCWNKWCHFHLAGCTNLFSRVDMFFHESFQFLVQGLCFGRQFKYRATTQWTW